MGKRNQEPPSISHHGRKYFTRTQVCKVVYALELVTVLWVLGLGAIAGTTAYLEKRPGATSRLQREE